MVVLLPTDEKLSENFNSTAAWEFFRLWKVYRMVIPTLFISFGHTPTFQKPPVSRDGSAVELSTSWIFSHHWLRTSHGDFIAWDSMIDQLQELSVDTMVIKGVNRRLKTNCSDHDLCESRDR